MSVTEQPSTFEQELKARKMLGIAREITSPLGLLPDDLRHDPEGPIASPVIAEARSRFAQHLHLTLGWSLAMTANLMNYKSRNMISYLIGAGKGPKHNSARRRSRKFADKGRP